MTLEHLEFVQLSTLQDVIAWWLQNYRFYVQYLTPQPGLPRYYIDLDFRVPYARELHHQVTGYLEIKLDDLQRDGNLPENVQLVRHAYDGFSWFGLSRQ